MKKKRLMLSRFLCEWCNLKVRSIILCECVCLCNKWFFFVNKYFRIQEIGDEDSAMCTQVQGVNINFKWKLIYCTVGKEKFFEPNQNNITLVLTKKKEDFRSDIKVHLNYNKKIFFLSPSIDFHFQVYYLMFF